MTVDVSLDILVVDNADKTAISIAQESVGQTAHKTQDDPRNPIRDSPSTSLRFLATNTIMHSADDKRALASFVLDACSAPLSTKA